MEILYGETDQLVKDIQTVIGDDGKFNIFPPSLNGYLSLCGFNDTSIDLSWVSEDFKTFCKDYLLPSKVVFDQLVYDPLDYQCEVVDAIENSRIVGIFKSRQLGLSETLCAYIIWKMLGGGKQEKGFKAIVYSETQTDAKKLGDRIVTMLLKIENKVPKWRLNNRDHRAFSQGWGDSEFLPVTGGRGSPGVNLIVIDECDWIDEVDILLTAAKPTLSASGGTLVQITTPNGSGKPTYKLIDKIIPNLKESIKTVKPKDSEKHWCKFSKTLEQNTMTAFIIHWRAYPHYDDKWKETTKYALDYSDEQWEQEFELETEISTTLFFNKTGKIDACVRYIPTKIKDGIVYTGLDTGGKRDNVAFCAIHYDFEKQEFQGIHEYYEKNQSTIKQDKEIIKLSKHYRAEKLIVEVNHNISQAQNLNQYLPETEIIEHFTTYNKKVTALKILRKLIYNKKIFFGFNSVLLDELPYFQIKPSSSNNMKLEARAGYHDDMIMAYANTLFYMIDLHKQEDKFLSEILQLEDGELEKINEEDWFI